MKKFFLLGVILVTLVVLYLFLSNVNSGLQLSEKDKSSALLSLLGRKARTDITPKKDKEYKGEYVYFKYPGEAKIYTYRPAGFEEDKAVSEYFSFDISVPRLIFSFSVVTTFVQNVNDYPSVKFREDNKGLYEKEEFTLSGKKGVVFEREGREAEKSAFFLIDSKIYAITVTGTSIEEIRNLFKKVSSNLKFL